jgi:hypothetical protein
MSYCIFGNAVCCGGESTRDDRAQAAILAFSRAGSEKSMIVRLGEGMIPKNLQKILDEDAVVISGPRIPFLIAGPKQVDNSEGILFLEGVNFSSSEYRGFLLNRLHDLQFVFHSLLAANGFAAISVIFSSAYDPNDHVIACSVSEMAQIAYEELRLRNWFASFKLAIHL